MRFSLLSPRRRPRPWHVALVVAGVVAVLLLVPVASAVGVFGGRTYLFVSQDPAELRPYGGYVGAYAVVELAFGRVVRLDYGDSKSLDDVYQERLDSGEIDGSAQLRHLYAASLSPDFPTAARAMADAYGEITDDWPDGVVAVDPAVASALLRIVGPVSVGDDPQPVTDTNVLQLVLEHTQDFDNPDVDRKQFVYDLGVELIQRLRALPPAAWPAVVQAIDGAARERHLQVYVDDPLLGRLVHDRGWDGAYPPPVEDFVAVVDTNVGYNKANLVTDQALAYHVELGAAGSADATLTVTYTNRGTDQLGFRTDAMPYLDHAVYDADVQVYAPRGSRPEPPSRRVQADADLQRVVFDDHVTVPSGAPQSLTFQYRLPDLGLDGKRLRYDLLVRKQAGTDAVPFTLRVTGPAGWRAVDTGAQEWQARSQLATDCRFSVTFEPGSG